MDKIKRWWNSVSGRLAPLAEGGKQAEDTTANELRRMLQRCPVCGGGFENHDYTHFAVTVFVEEKRGRVKEFFEACEERRWEAVLQFQEFDPKRDAIVAYALRCAASRLALVIERNPAEMYESDRLISCDALDEVSGQRLEQIIAQGNWRKLNWT
ncbi:MAG: hypothetical protein AB7U82_04105 [Blastocatellales bacterium]